MEKEDGNQAKERGEELRREKGSKGRRSKPPVPISHGALLLVLLLLPPSPPDRDGTTKQPERRR